MPGVPWHTQILVDQLTLFQPGGIDYAHLITTGTPRFSDLLTALNPTQPDGVCPKNGPDLDPQVQTKITWVRNKEVI